MAEFIVRLVRTSHTSPPLNPNPQKLKMPDEFVFGVDMIARVKGKVKNIYAYVDRRKGKDAFASGR